MVEVDRERIEGQLLIGALLLTGLLVEREGLIPDSDGQVALLVVLRDRRPVHAPDRSLSLDRRLLLELAVQNLDDSAHRT